jgi:hypothetical protein
VVVLVGAAPDLEFLETDTQLGQVPGNPIDKNNPIDIGTEHAIQNWNQFNKNRTCMVKRRSLNYINYSQIDFRHKQF